MDDEPKQTIRMRVKLSWLELEYEGPASQVPERVIPLLNHMLEAGAQNVSPLDQEDDHGTAKQQGTKKGPVSLGQSTDIIASKLSAKTGADLALAASAKLLFVDGQEQFSRKEILREMRLAPAFYKGTYSNNLTSSLETLVKSDRLRLIGPDRHTISAKERERLNALANSA